MFRGAMGEDMGQARRTGLRQTGGPVTMDLKGAVMEVRELLESCSMVYNKRWLKSVFIEALFCARGTVHAKADFMNIVVQQLHSRRLRFYCINRHKNNNDGY